MVTANQKPDTTISITEKASIKIKHFIEKEKAVDGSGLRVGVKGGGCSGLVYTLTVAAQPKEDDKIIDDKGVKVFIPKKSYIFLAGMVLDFSDGLNGKGFTFENPKAKKTCGCGNSFAV